MKRKRKRSGAGLYKARWVRMELNDGRAKANAGVSHGLGGFFGVGERKAYSSGLRRAFGASWYISGRKAA